MSRFRRLSQSEIEGLYRHAQEVNEGTHLGCPACQQWFPRSSVQETRKGKYVPGRFRITCPLCGAQSPAMSFSYYYPEQDPKFPKRGWGTRLDNSNVAQRVNPSAPPGITTIS